MIFEEGETKIYVPFSINHHKKGPLSKIPGFYNPILEFDRDICILFTQYLKDEGYGRFLDGLAATGIRGIRAAKEVGGDIFINEWSEKSIRLIKKNLRLNRVTASITKKDLRILLLERNNYDFIDIDPYGSPADFIDSAFQCAHQDGFMAFTSTDKATLCGVYPSVCKRRYDAVPSHGEAMKEIGLRILVGFLARQAARYDYSIEPLLSYSKDHYFRVYVKTERGAKKANETIKNIGWISKEEGSWTVLSGNFSIGPLWIGKLQNKKMLDELTKRLNTKKLGRRWEIERFLHLLGSEIDAPPLYYETDEIASRIQRCQPRILDVIEDLKEKGFHATRTHFHPSAVKTDAPIEELEHLFSD